MNLNRGHKADIVRAIMSDVPKVDYPELIRDYVQEEAVKMMPPEVRAVYGNPELRRYLEGVQMTVHTAHFYTSVNVIWCRSFDEAACSAQTIYLTKRQWNDNVGTPSRRLVDAVYVTVCELAERAAEQSKAMDAMERKLRTMLQGIRTLKQAKTMLEPELHRYLPVEPPKDPARKAAQASTALVPYVVDAMKEMGWPKDKSA